MGDVNDETNGFRKGIFIDCKALANKVKTKPSWLNICRECFINVIKQKQGNTIHRVHTIFGTYNLKSLKLNVRANHTKGLSYFCYKTSDSTKIGQ